MQSEQAPRTDIGWAVNQLRAGGRVRRSGWNGAGMFLELDANLNVKRLYQSGNEAWPMEDIVWMKTTGETMVPWLCSQTDLLATDWELAK